jgi:CTD kinase subunit alpha
VAPIDKNYSLKAPTVVASQSTNPGRASQEQSRVSDDENPFRPSKELRVEDQKTQEEKVVSNQANSSERADASSPQSSKISFSLKSASKPVASSAPKIDLSQKAREALDPGPNKSNARPDARSAQPPAKATPDHRPEYRYDRERDRDRIKDRERERDRDRERDRERDRYRDRERDYDRDWDRERERERERERDRVREREHERERENERDMWQDKYDRREDFRRRDGSRYEEPRKRSDHPVRSERPGQQVRPVQQVRAKRQIPKTSRIKLKVVRDRIKDKPQLVGDSITSESVYYRKPGNESVVGSGTYGKVFKALHVYSGNMVALKKIRMEGERDGVSFSALRKQ